MAVDSFMFVEMYDRVLVTAGHLLTKGQAHALATGVSDAELLEWRLVDDMYPLRFQLTLVANFSQRWLARVAGLPLPAEVGDALDVDGLQAALASSRAFLAGLTAEQFAGRADVPLAVPIGPGMEPTMPAGRWISGFATTNLYFHLSTAYGILRAHGVPLGKPDLFAGGL